MILELQSGKSCLDMKLHHCRYSEGRNNQDDHHIRLHFTNNNQNLIMQKLINAFWTKQIDTMNSTEIENPEINTLQEKTTNNSLKIEKLNKLAAA